MRAVHSLLRKQEWEIATIQSGAVQAGRLLEQLSSVGEQIGKRIARAEEAMRAGAGGEASLSVHELELNRRFLRAQRAELVRVEQERVKAEMLVQKFMDRIKEERLRARIYERLAEKRQAELSAAELRGEARRADEAWLLSRTEE